MQDETRRKDKLITEEEARAVLEKAEYGFLGTASSENEPYVVPLSFIVKQNKIYFHCAKEGKKLNNIAGNPSVCFCVVGATEPIYDNGFSTYYESCTVFGAAQEVMEESEKHEVLLDIARKYLPDHMDKAEDYITKFWTRTALYAIPITRITGKGRRKKS